MSNTLNLTYKDSTITLETGRIARQADGAIWASEGDTRILASAVFRKVADPNKDFFPLTVNYQEKFYAVGRIPGSFFRREGRPTERETLLCRLIDRPIRPLFPKDFVNEVQVITTVMSKDAAYETDILALNASSAAVAIAGLPISNLMAACRVGWIDDEIVINPSIEQMAVSRLDMVVAGTKDAILMVESEADQLSEEQMLKALAEAQQCITAYTEQMAGWKVYQDAEKFEIVDTKSDLYDAAKALVEKKLDGLFAKVEGTKHERREQINEFKKMCSVDACNELLPAEDDPKRDELTKLISGICQDLEKKHLRNEILEHQRRVDGRKLDEIRPIDITIGDLPQAHGSAIFTRGETQAIVSATLAGKKSSQLVETLTGVNNDGFMLHYNFPPYSVGETGMMIGPKRREIGHGKLAKRAIAPVMPDIEDQYTLRLVSEITESNGSSSMASVCGSTLAMLDAGIHITANIAGIAMGLVLEGTKFQVLSDILGDEDHLGDMDFKVAGSKDGITALQMDIKIAGVSAEIMTIALEQAKAGRLHILEIMEKVISTPAELSANAPRLATMDIPKQKIGAVIGKSGVNIKAIQNDFGVEVEIADNGTVSIFAQNEETVNQVADFINEIIADLEPGRVYEGEIEEIRNFGIFVVVTGGKSGLIHSSKFPSGVDFEKEYKVGDPINALMEEMDSKGRASFALADYDVPKLVPNTEYAVEVIKLVPSVGAVVRCNDVPVEGLIHISKISSDFIKNIEEHVSVGDQLQAIFEKEFKGRNQFTLIKPNNDGSSGSEGTGSQGESSTESSNDSSDKPAEQTRARREEASNEPVLSAEELAKLVADLNLATGDYHVVKVSRVNNRLGVFVTCKSKEAKGLLHISKITNDYISRANKVIHSDQLMIAQINNVENGPEKLSFSTIGLENVNQSINNNFPFQQTPLTPGSSCLASLSRVDADVIGTLPIVTEDGENVELSVKISNCEEGMDLSAQHYWIIYHEEKDGVHMGQVILIDGEPLSHTTVEELAVESNPS